MALLTTMTGVRAVDKPNIVFILADDQGYEDAGLAGGDKLHSNPGTTLVNGRHVL